MSKSLFTLALASAVVFGSAFAMAQTTSAPANSTAPVASSAAAPKKVEEAKPVTTAPAKPATPNK